MSPYYSDPALVDKEDRNQPQTLLADATPHLQLALEGSIPKK